MERSPKNSEQRISMENVLDVDDVRRNWRVAEDSGIAYNLQRDEYNHHFNQNRSERRTMRDDTQISRHEQQLEDNFTDEYRAQLRYDMEREDALLAKKLQRELELEDDTEKRRLELLDEELARRLQDDEDDVTRRANQENRQFHNIAQPFSSPSSVKNSDNNQNINDGDNDNYINNTNNSTAALNYQRHNAQRVGHGSMLTNSVQRDSDRFLNANYKFSFPPCIPLDAAYAVQSAYDKNATLVLPLELSKEQLDSIYNVLKEKDPRLAQEVKDREMALEMQQKVDAKRDTSKKLLLSSNAVTQLLEPTLDDPPIQTIQDSDADQTNQIIYASNQQLNQANTVHGSAIRRKEGDLISFEDIDFAIDNRSSSGISPRKGLSVVGKNPFLNPQRSRELDIASDFEVTSFGRGSINSTADYNYSLNDAHRSTLRSGSISTVHASPSVNVASSASREMSDTLQAGRRPGFCQANRVWNDLN